jgi:hypothetical protein
MSSCTIDRKNADIGFAFDWQDFWVIGGVEEGAYLFGRG